MTAKLESFRPQAIPTIPWTGDSGLSNISFTVDTENSLQLSGRPAAAKVNSALHFQRAVKTG